jgi:hypothetical protein
MSQKLNSVIAVISIDIGKNSFHVVDLDARWRNRAAAEVVAWPVETRLANLSSCITSVTASSCSVTMPG